MSFERIAAFALGPADVPDTALDAAATLLIDTLGVAAGAANLEAGRIAREHAVRFQAPASPKEAAPLLFDGRKTSLTGAGFAAATQIDNFDAHDGYNPTKGHIGCAVVPALCAFAEHRPDLSGREALAAMVIAYELAARAAIALHATVSDYHTSGAWNALGVAALGCRLRGHTTDQLRHALGIAEYHGPRSQMMREIANPSMLHDGSGMGAMVGIMATVLAEDGFQGAPAITVENAPEHWADLGARWTIEENYIKPYPVCRWAHAALDAASDIVASHRVQADRIAKVTVRTFAEAAALFPDAPTTTSQAQYSLRFALATHLVVGHIGPVEVQGKGLRNPAVLEMMKRIEITEDPRHSSRFPKARWSDVTLHLTDGRVLKSGDVHARGGPESPMARSEVEAKFHLMAAALSDARRTAIWDTRDSLLEPDFSFRTLLDLVTAPMDA